MNKFIAWILIFVAGVCADVNVKRSLSEIVKSASDFKTVVLSYGSTPTSLRIGEPTYINGKLVVPATIDFSQFTNSGKFFGTTGSAKDTLVISRQSARPMHQIADSSVVLMYAAGAVGDVCVWWFGDDESAIKRAIKSAAYYSGTPIKFKDLNTYNITSIQGIVLTEKDGLDLQFQNATLKRTSGNGAILTLKGCSHIKISNLSINGNALASVGLNYQSNQDSAGIGGYVGYGSSFNKFYNVNIATCSTGIMCGKYTSDSRDDAIDRSEFYGFRIYDCRDAILIDSKNARDLRFFGTNIRVSASAPAASIDRTCIKVLRGDADFSNIYTSGNGGPHLWVWKIYDGFVRVDSWYDENGHSTGAGNAGMIRCYPRVFDTSVKQTSLQGSTFINSKLYFNGTSGDDVPDGVAIAMDSVSRSLKMINCDFSKASAANRIVRVHRNSDGYYSLNCTYTSTTRPFGAWKNNATMGKVSSYGDRLYDYSNYIILPSGDYSADTASEAGISLNRENVPAYKDLGRTITWNQKIDTTTNYYENGSIGFYKSNDTMGNKDFYFLLKTRSSTDGVFNLLKGYPSGLLNNEHVRGAIKAPFLWAGSTGDTSLTYARLQLVGSTANWIRWGSTGTAAPSFTTRSNGTKLMLYSTLSGSAVDYALGLGNDNDMWFSVPNTAAGYRYKWYFGTTEKMRLDAGLGLRVYDTVSSTSPTTGALVVSGGAGFGKYITQPGIYGELHIHDNSTSQAIPTGATYTKLTCFPGIGFCSNVTCDTANDKITFTKTGKYRVGASLSFLCGTNNVEWKATAFLNNVEQDQIHFERKIGTAGDIGNAGVTGFVNVTTVPWDLDLRAKHDNGGSIDLTVRYGNFNVEYVGE